EHDRFILNGPDVDSETAAVLQRLTDLGLVDPGYTGPTTGKPYLWTANGNGSRALRYALESRLTINPRARTALASLSWKNQLAVLEAAVSLQARAPASWPSEEAVRLAEDKPVYLLHVTRDLRAFIRVLDSRQIELSDIVREETLRLFLERERAAGAHP